MGGLSRGSAVGIDADCVAGYPRHKTETGSSLGGILSSALASAVRSHSIGDPTQHAPSPLACAASKMIIPARQQSSTGPQMMITQGAPQNALKSLGCVHPRPG